MRPKRPPRRAIPMGILRVGKAELELSMVQWQSEQPRLDLRLCRMTQKYSGRTTRGWLMSFEEAAELHALLGAALEKWDGASRAASS